MQSCAAFATPGCLAQAACFRARSTPQRRQRRRAYAHRERRASAGRAPCKGTGRPPQAFDEAGADAAGRGRVPWNATELDSRRNATQELRRAKHPREVGKNTSILQKRLGTKSRTWRATGPGHPGHPRHPRRARRPGDPHCARRSLDTSLPPRTLLARRTPRAGGANRASGPGAPRRASRSGRPGVAGGACWASGAGHSLSTEERERRATVSAGGESSVPSARKRPRPTLTRSARASRTTFAAVATGTRQPHTRALRRAWTPRWRQWRPAPGGRCCTRSRRPPAPAPSGACRTRCRLRSRTWRNGAASRRGGWLPGPACRSGGC